MSIYKKFKLLLCSIIGLSQSSYGCNQPIEKIIIKTFIDSPLYTTAEIEILDKVTLSNIQSEWCSFQKTDEYPEISEGEEKVNWTHSLTITAGGKLEGIWLYKTSGFLGRLNKQLKPRYLIANPDSFNKSLGIASKK